MHQNRPHLRRLTSWVPLLVTVVLLPTFLALSHWQWTKSQTKAALKQEVQKVSESQPEGISSIAQLQTLHQQFGRSLMDQRATLTGTFLQDPLLIRDNRIHNTQVGYHIIALLQVNDQAPLMPVNLGWHPLIEHRRDIMPAISLPSSKVTVSGPLFFPHADRYVLSDQMMVFATQSGTAHLIQRFDPQQIESLIDQAIMPFTLRANRISPTSAGIEQLTTEWQPQVSIGISAEKHQGYALQWLTFAAILLGLFMKFHFFPSKSLDNTHANRVNI